MLGWELVLIAVIVLVLAIYAAGEVVAKVAEAVAEHFDIDPPLTYNDRICPHGYLVIEDWCIECEK